MPVHGSFSLSFQYPLCCCLWITGHFAHEWITENWDTHSAWMKATVSYTFPMIQPCPLFLDMIENLFSFSIGKPAWVRPDGCWPSGDGEGERFPTVLITQDSDLLWSHSLEKLTPRKHFSLNVDFTGCVLRSLRLRNCHGVNTLCSGLDLWLFMHGSPGTSVINILINKQRHLSSDV